MMTPGWLNSNFGAYAFSVVEEFNPEVYGDFSLSSFVHELGHNLGCDHNRENAYGGVRPYSYGYWFTGADAISYGTVMSYVGTRLPFFSNPRISDQGHALGSEPDRTDAAFNALTLSETGAVAASFRTCSIDWNQVDPAGNYAAVVAYPVPARDKLHFAWKTPGVQAANIDVFNFAGECIARIGAHSAEGNVLNWDCRDLAPGVYFCRVRLTASGGGETEHCFKIAIRH